jgi:hypothetical protein
MCLRLKEHEALSYLQERGYTVSHDLYYRLRKEVKESTNTRLNLIASEEFSAQHLTRLDTLRTVENELWNQYHVEKSPSNKSKILMNIAELQQYLSSYYDSTQYVMQQSAKHKQEQKQKESN